MSTTEKNSSEFNKVVEEISNEFFKGRLNENQLNQNQLNQSQANQEQLKSSIDLLELESKITSLAAETPQDLIPQNQFFRDQTSRDESDASANWFVKIRSWFGADHQVYYSLCAVMMIAVMAAWLAPSTFFDGQNQPPQISELSVVNQPADELELTFHELWLVENELLFSEEI